MPRCGPRIYKLKHFSSTIATYWKDVRYRRQPHDNGCTFKAVKNDPPWKIWIGRFAPLSRQKPSQASSAIDIQFYENVVTSWMWCLDAVSQHHQQQGASWNIACITGAFDVNRTETVAEAIAFSAGFIHTEMDKSRHPSRTCQRYRNSRNIFRQQATSSVYMTRSILEPKTNIYWISKYFYSQGCYKICSKCWLNWIPLNITGLAPISIAERPSVCCGALSICRLFLGHGDDKLWPLYVRLGSFVVRRAWGALPSDKSVRERLQYFNRNHL